MTAQLRLINPLDTYTLMFLVGLGIFTFLKITHHSAFMKLYSTRALSYTLGHQKENNIFSVFNILLTLIVGWSIAIILSNTFPEVRFGYSDLTYIAFLTTIYCIFRLAHGFISYVIIGFLLHKKQLIKPYIKLKIRFLNILSVPLFFSAATSTYTGIESNILAYILLIFVGLSTLFFIAKLWGLFKDVITAHFYYFILYFCALEIAPYYILLKLNAII